jgi:hypothetical protein
VLYFLLASRPLYDGAIRVEVLRQAAQARYDATALRAHRVPKHLTAVCRKALARAPQARFESAAEMAEELKSAVRPPPWRLAAMLALLLLTAGAMGWLLGQPFHSGPGAVTKAAQPALEVQVWRPSQHYTRLSDALPVHTGDEIQVRFRVPPGLHIGLCSINGQGQLTLLERYPPQGAETELVYPGPDRTKQLDPPAGTEIVLVCGRNGVSVDERELQTMWRNNSPWPALEPTGRLLRLQLDHVREEGERSRDFGATHHHPGSDAVALRLEGLRERLKQDYSFFEGLAFAHE